MGYKAIVQVILLVVSVVIITTYIKPTFSDMSRIQAEAADYQEALDNETKYQDRLAELESVAGSFSISEKRALERYLPNKIDTIAIMRDIETIVLNQGMSLQGLTSEERELPTESDVKTVGGQGQDQEIVNVSYAVQKFQLVAVGTYDQFTNLLQDFERNAYPLEVASITLTPSENDFYTFNIILETYSLVNESDIYGITR